MNVRIGHRGDRWVEIVDPHRAVKDPVEFLDVAAALRFLREHADGDDLRRLRGVLADDVVRPGRLDDAGLLARVAHRLHTRTLRAVLRRDRRFTAVHAPALEPAPMSLPAQTVPPRIEPAPAPAPALPFDPAAQARTLRSAARDGVPFCEICQPRRG